MGSRNSTEGAQSTQSESEIQINKVLLSCFLGALRVLCGEISKELLPFLVPLEEYVQRGAKDVGIRIRTGAAM